MFKVIFCKSIWDGDSPESSTMLALFQRGQDLPFSPTPGVEIAWHGLSQAISKVRWEPAESLFVCNMSDERPHSIGYHTYDFNWLMKTAIDNGWTLVSKEMSPARR